MRRTNFGRRDFLRIGAGAGAAMTTGLFSRGTSAQGKSGPPVSIDMHTHWAPEAYTKLMSHLRRQGGGGGGGANQAQASAQAPGAGQGPNPLTFDLDKRKQWMDTHGVQMHVLSLSGGMPWQWVDPGMGASLAQAINDASVEAHTAFPDRFMGTVEMSIRDPVGSLRELNRMAGKPGIRTVHLPNSIESHDYLFEDRYAPLLARIEELGYPILFHPLDGDANIFGGWKSRLATDVAKSGNLNNTLGFPFEHTTTATKFIITGTLDKYPKLEIVLPHAGGAFPYHAGRIHRGVVNRGNYEKRQMAFRDYIKRFHYDTLAYYPETLRFLISLVGPDRVVIGTDNFAGMDVEYPNALVEQLNLPAADRDKIFKGNAARLLRL